MLWKKFWKLLVLAESHNTGDDIYRECECECWWKKIISWLRMRAWKTKSCWCLMKEYLAKKTRTHWLKHTRFYRIYFAARSRCLDAINNRYYRYGWRGVQFLWETFEDFRKDMYESYLCHVKEYWEKNTTIDRINNDLHYNKDNCRWATYYEQQHNK